MPKKCNVSVEDTYSYLFRFAKVSDLKKIAKRYGVRPRTANKEGLVSLLSPHYNEIRKDPEVIRICTQNQNSQPQSSTKKSEMATIQNLTTNWIRSFRIGQQVNLMLSIRHSPSIVGEEIHYTVSNFILQGKIVSKAIHKDSKVLNLVGVTTITPKEVITSYDITKTTNTDDTKTSTSINTITNDNTNTSNNDTNRNNNNDKSSCNGNSNNNDDKNGDGTDEDEEGYSDDDEDVIINNSIDNSDSETGTIRNNNNSSSITINNNNNNNSSPELIMRAQRKKIITVEITNIPSEIYKLNNPWYIPNLYIGKRVNIYHYRKQYAPTTKGKFFKPCFCTTIYEHYCHGDKLRLISPFDNHDVYRDMLDRTI